MYVIDELQTLSLWLPGAAKDSMKSTKIGIVGAGPGGLALALTLQQAGFSDVSVFERSETLPCARGGTIRIDDRSQEAMQAMGVLEHANSLGLYNTSFDTFGNGKLLQSPTPVTSLSISREALQKVLAEAIEPGIIKLNKKLPRTRGRRLCAPGVLGWDVRDVRSGGRG